MTLKKGLTIHMLFPGVVGFYVKIPVSLLPTFLKEHEEN